MLINNNIISIIAFTILLFTIATNGIKIDIDNNQKSLIHKVDDATSFYTCTTSHKVKQCQFLNNQVICPNVNTCLSQFEGYGNFTIYIPSGLYSSCPNDVGTLSISGQLTITSLKDNNDLPVFSCTAQRFIQFTISKPLIVVISNLHMTAGSTQDGGCINALALPSVTNSSSLIINNVIGSFCTAEFNGGFLNTNISDVYVLNTQVSNSAVESGSGGAIFASPLTNLVVSDCIILFCTALANSGGAIAGTYITINKSQLFNNGAYIAGAVYGYTLNITEGIFIQNYCSFVGGALYSINVAFIDNSYFEYNTAGSAASLYGSSNITITNTQFKYGKAQFSGSGGAIMIANEYYVQPSILTIINSSFVGNQADGNGGAIFGPGALAYYINSTEFIDNTANYSGGAIHIANSLSFNYHSKTFVNIFDSIFSNNEATLDGGAICLLQSYKSSSVDVNLLGSKLIQNSAGRYAGGIYFLNTPTYPSTLLGGVFVNSKSSQIDTTTFYSASLKGQRIANITNINLPQYTITIFDESTFQYYKAYNVIGSCNDGVATINANGQILSCTCFSPATGPNCLI